MSEILTGCKFSGADWVKNCFRIELSPLGVRAADLLGDVFYGIYHLDNQMLKRVQWDNPTWIYLPDIGTSFSTFDSNDLTRLVIAAHDRALRCDIGIGRQLYKRSDDYEDEYDFERNLEPTMLNDLPSDDLRYIRYGLSLTIHARKREGKLWERHPTIEEAITSLR